MRERSRSLPSRSTDLTVAYHEQPVLWDVDLEVPRGVLMAIVGPNGAGKTTLIKAILGLVPPAAGPGLASTASPTPSSAHLVGYVPQRGSVDWDFPTDVLDVVMMGRYGALGWVRRPGQPRARAGPRGAAPRSAWRTSPDRQISQLSGGQQQRVFLARALVQDAQHLPDGRAVPGRGRHHRARHRRAAAGAARGRQDRAGGAPRPADRARVLRLGHAAQRAAHRQRPGGRGLHRGEPAPGLRRAHRLRDGGTPAEQYAAGDRSRLGPSGTVAGQHGHLQLLHDLFFDYTLRTVALGRPLWAWSAARWGRSPCCAGRACWATPISHAALPGIALAFLLDGLKGPLVLDAGRGRRRAGSARCSSCADHAHARASSRTARWASSLSVFFGFGLMLLTFIQQHARRRQAGLDKFLFGQAATLLRRDVVIMAALGAIVAGARARCSGRSSSCSASIRDFGASLGFPMRRARHPADLC